MRSAGVLLPVAGAFLLGVHDTSVAKEPAEVRVKTVEEIRRAAPNVVVSDLRMPGEDGHAFLRKVRALPRDRGGRIPAVALTGMTTREARVVLIDRVSPEDLERRAYQNRLEKLRTPSKTYVYSESQLVAALANTGLVVEAQAWYAEEMQVHEWLGAAGPDEETAHTILTLLTADGDPAGLQVRCEGDRLLMTHQTCVLVARRR